MVAHWVARVVLFAIGLSAQSQQRGATPSPAPLQSYRIAGVVVDSVSGGPIPSATVAIAPTTDRSGDATRAVTTSADGRFAFSGLKPGKYSLMASARGFGLQYFERHDAYSTAVAVGPDLESERLVFRMEPEASIEGQVTDDNNDPVQNALVRLFQKRPENGQVFPANQSQTDDQGRFRIGHLEPGAYYLTVAARPWYAQNDRRAMQRLKSEPDAQARVAQEAAALDVTYPLTFYPDSPDSSDANPIVLHPGERATTDIVMHPVPAIHLRIRTGAAGNTASTTGGTNVPRVSQRLFDGYVDPVFNAPVAVEPGEVEIMGLAPGHYIVEMTASGPVNEKASRGWYQEIDLAGDAELNAESTSGFAAVTGTVFFQDADAVPRNSSIVLSNPTTGETFNAAISDKGQVDFGADAIKQGRYNVLLGGSQRFSISRLTATGAKMIGRTLEISAAGNVRITCVAARGLGQVDGVVLRNGEPFAGAMVVLVPQDSGHNGPLFRRDQSDSDGTFTLPDVVPGAYTVIALANGWGLEWGNPAVLQPYLKGGEAVRVAGDAKLQVKVQLQ